MLVRTKPPTKLPSTTRHVMPQPRPGLGWRGRFLLSAIVLYYYGTYGLFRSVCLTTWEELHTYNSSSNSTTSTAAGFLGFGVHPSDDQSAVTEYRRVGWMEYAMLIAVLAMGFLGQVILMLRLTERLVKVATVLLIVISFIQVSVVIGALRMFKPDFYTPGVQVTSGFVGAVSGATCYFVASILFIVDACLNKCKNVDLGKSRRRILIANHLAMLVLSGGGVGFHYFGNIKFTESFNFALVTLLTIGYGNTVITSDSGRVFLYFYFLIGAAVLSFFVMGMQEYMMEKLHDEAERKVISRQIRREQRRAIIQARRHHHQQQKQLKRASSSAWMAVPPDGQTQTTSSSDFGKRILIYFGILPNPRLCDLHALHEAAEELSLPGPTWLPVTIRKVMHLRMGEAKKEEEVEVGGGLDVTGDAVVGPELEAVLNEPPVDPDVVESGNTSVDVGAEGGDDEEALRKENDIDVSRPVPLLTKDEQEPSSSTLLEESTTIATSDGTSIDGNVTEQELKMEGIFQKQVERRKIRRVVLMIFGIWLFGAYIFSRLEPDWSYSDAVYFCFCTMTTIGYGDFYPTNHWSWEFWNIFVIGAVAAYAQIVAAASDLFAQSYTSTSEVMQLRIEKQKEAKLMRKLQKLQTELRDAQLKQANTAATPSLPAQTTAGINNNSNTNNAKHRKSLGNIFSSSHNSRTPTPTSGMNE